MIVLNHFTGEYLALSQENLSEGGLNRHQSRDCAIEINQIIDSIHSQIIDDLIYFSRHDSDNALSLQRQNDIMSFLIELPNRIG